MANANYGHAGRPGQVGGSAPSDEGGGISSSVSSTTYGTGKDAYESDISIKGMKPDRHHPASGYYGPGSGTDANAEKEIDQQLKKHGFTEAEKTGGKLKSGVIYKHKDGTIAIKHRGSIHVFAPRGAAKSHQSEESRYAENVGRRETRSGKYDGGAKHVESSGRVQMHPDEAKTAAVAVKPGVGYGITTDKGHYGDGRWVVKPHILHSRETMQEEVDALKQGKSMKLGGAAGSPSEHFGKGKELEHNLAMAREHQSRERRRKK